MDTNFPARCHEIIPSRGRECDWPAVATVIIPEQRRVCGFHARFAQARGDNVAWDDVN